MIIHVKNKNTLIINDFELKCCIGKNGLNSNKIESWIESIIKTKQKNLKIVKKLDEGKKDRDEFKKKYKI